MKKIYFVLVFSMSFNGCSMMMGMVPVPKSIVKEMFDEVDKNRDGYFTQEEYAKDYRSDDPEGLKEEASKKGMREDAFLNWSYKKLDTNSDGKVKFEEFYKIINENKEFD